MAVELPREVRDYLAAMVRRINAALALGQPLGEEYVGLLLIEAGRRGLNLRRCKNGKWQRQLDPRCAPVQSTESDDVLADEYAKRVTEEGVVA